MPEVGESHPLYRSIYWTGEKWCIKRKKKKAKNHEVCSAVYCKRTSRCEIRGERIIRASLCNCHRSRLRRLNYPIKWSYDDFKWRAKRRKITFTLTLEEWTAFVVQHDLLYRTKRGLSRVLHVDRKDPTKGYHHWNIQPLTISENTAKRNKEYAQGQYWQGEEEEGDPLWLVGEEPSNPDPF